MPKQMNYELRATMHEAEELSRKQNLTGTEKLRMSYLMSKLSILKTHDLSTEPDTRWFKQFVRGELRSPMQEGTQTISYTEGAEGGYLAPIEFSSDVIYGSAQLDPLLDENAVTLIQSNDFSLKPFTVPAWDLSSFAAVKISEGSQQTGQTPPALAGAILNGYKYKCSLPASYELEEDSYPVLMAQMKNAFSVGIARGVGADLVNGNGSTGPAGLATGAAVSGITTAAHGQLSLGDFTKIFFAVNRIFRQSPKCAWVMNDSTYMLCRNAVDGNGRPLLSIENDEEKILSKKVLVSPSVGNYIYFGDLSRFIVRVSRLMVQRQTQLPGYAENAMALYCGWLRCDAKVIDPTAGSVPPIVSAALHS